MAASHMTVKTKGWVHRGRHAHPPQSLVSLPAEDAQNLVQIGAAEFPPDPAQVSAEPAQTEAA